MPLTPPASSSSPLDAPAVEAARQTDPDLPQPWERQVAASGYCSRPVRLAGGVEVVNRATGEIRTVYTTAGEPDGVLLTGCGNRRASRCRSCSDTYRADTWQLVAAGLRGGKSLPESVAGHPRLFVTLTAPSFGPVHSRRETSRRARRCHPAAGTCAHGRPRGCPKLHDETDERLGSPLCPDCFDYPTAVLWNAVLPELWRRTTIYLHRALAARAGLSRAQLNGRVRIAFTKVAEYQARGVVHLHAVLRIDARPPADQPDQVAPPPAEFDAELLAAAVRDTARAVTAPLPSAAADGTPGMARWGRQLHLREITTSGEASNPEAVAAYVAKYATKSSTDLGHALDHRLYSEAEIAALPVPEHLRRLVETCWTLGGRRHLAGLQLRRWAHMLGFRGHFATRSRRYSTTLTALRAARADFARRHRDRPQPGPDGDVDPWGRPADTATIEVVGRWRYAGTGYRDPVHRQMAADLIDRHHETEAAIRLLRRLQATGQLPCPIQAA